jgi:hypothetical protein
MEVPVMGPAQRYRELVADLEPHRAGLGEPQVVGVRGTSPADQTRLRCNELEMAFIAMPTWLAEREHAFVYFCGSSVASKTCRSRLTVIVG